MTLSFLADENISPESADYLKALGYPCHSLRRDGPWRLSDREIVALAKRDWEQFTGSTRGRVVSSEHECHGRRACRGGAITLHGFTD
jgi:hypothetical protein